MLHELENILYALNIIDAQTEADIFQKDEIQKQLKEIDDFPELLHTIHYNVTLLRHEDIYNISNILKIVLKIDWQVCSCISNIEAVRKRVTKVKEYYAQRKNKESGKFNKCTTGSPVTNNNEHIIVYELQEMVKELTRIDAELQRGAYMKKYVQEAYEDLHEFSHLIDIIKQGTSALESTNVDNVSIMLELLADLEANLTSCANIIEAKNDFIRQFLRQFSSDEIIE